MLFSAVPALAATALVLSACGSQSSGATAVSPSTGRSAASSSASGTAAPASATRLTVHYVPAPGRAAKTWTLTCGPAGGDHPYAQQSCDLLAKAAAAGQDPFARTKVGVMCTMIYGGPQTATVTGTWQGRAINADFSRKNGCEVHRWETASPLVGEQPHAAPTGMG